MKAVLVYLILVAKLICADYRGLIDLDGDNWDQVVNNGKVVVEFYAPWCPHCRALEPEYIRVADYFRDNSKIAIARINCSEHRKKCHQYRIRSYPKIKFFNQGGNGEDVRVRKRDFDSIRQWIDHKLQQLG